MSALIYFLSKYKIKKRLYNCITSTVSDRPVLKSRRAQFFFCFFNKR